MSVLTTEEVFQDVFDYVKTLLEDTFINPYGAKVYPYEPHDYHVPCIVMKQMDLSLLNETLDHDEERYEMVIETNIYASEIGEYDKRDIANFYSDFIHHVLANYYRMKLTMRDPIPNIDYSIYRIVMRFRGIVDQNKNISR